MTSEAYVWVWLQRTTSPVVCGRLLDENGEIRFVYGRGYRDRDEAIPLDPYTLRLGSTPVAGPIRKRLPGAIADAAPDNWRRRVIEYRANQARSSEIDYPRKFSGVSPVVRRKMPSSCIGAWCSTS